MSDKIHLAIRQADSGNGDLRSLSIQLGSPEDLTFAGLAAYSTPMEKVRDAAGLGKFLRHYQDDLMFKVEFGAIERAFHLAARNEARELADFDRELTLPTDMAAFGKVSRRVGSMQLKSLRPLNVKLVQRYARAVEAGEANGWHTLVYGIVLSVYSLPLRQGLIYYGQQTMRGFIWSAARHLQLPEHTCEDLHENVCAGLVREVNHLLPAKEFTVV